MSVDVFGRQLTAIKRGGSRGPPGEGFKITPDGQYDMVNKRLCNLADPLDRNDAVSISAMQNAIQQEVRLVYAITTSLRNNVDDLDLMIRALESQFHENVKNERISSDTIQDLMMRNSQLITHLEDRLRTLEKDYHNDENNLMIQSFKSSVQEAIKHLETDTKTQQELTFRNSQIISQLNDRLTALEHAEGSHSRRAS